MLAGLADAAALVVGLDGKTVRGARTKDGKAPHLLADDLRVRAVLAIRTWTTKSQTSMHCIMSAMSPCAKTPQRLRAGSSAQVITAVRNTTVTVLRASRVHRHSSWLALGRAEPRQAHSSPQAFLARFRTWMDTRTDQVIIVGSLVLGFWLIANSIYLIVS